MYCKYSRDERKELFQQRMQDPTVLDWTRPEQWSAWNIAFKYVSQDYQDELWNLYFPKKTDDHLSKTILDKYTEWDKMNSLGCCITEVAKTPAYKPSASNLLWANPVVVKKWPCGLPDCVICEQEEKERAMRTAITSAPASYANAQVYAPQSEIAEQRAYLLDRLNTICWAKRDDERKPFGLVDDEAPKTIKERKERIAAGKYVFKYYRDEEDYDEDEEHYDIDRVTLRWRDPAVKEDQKGYDAAMEKLKKDMTSYRDTIRIKDADTGLAAVQEFEAKTYH